MKRKLGDFSGKIGDSLQIPKDLSYKEAVLTLTGSQDYILKNYKCIRQYHNRIPVSYSFQKEIKFKLREKISYSYYTDVEMKNKWKYQ